ncbi:unnamed protein product, partial [Symbiodinium microadriaticum]
TKKQILRICKFRDSVKIVPQKQTTARNALGEICCVGCGGIDGRGRPRKAVMPLSTSSSSSASGSEDDVLPRRARGTITITFEGEEYKSHQALLPVAYREMVMRWADRLGFTNSRLWASFAYFVLLLASVQPEGFFSADARAKLEAALAAVPPLHLQLMTTGSAQGVFPCLDTFSRGRPRFSARMYKRLFPHSRQYTAEKLSAWLLLECCFRYAGEPRILEEFLFTDDALPRLRDALGDGLCESNAESVAEFLQSVFVQQATLRSSVRAAFATRDGRRRTDRSTVQRAGQRKAPRTGNDVMPKRVAADSRYFDNMVAALVPWSRQSIVTGQALHKVLDLVDAFSQHQPDDASNFDALKRSMNTLLTRQANFTFFPVVNM